MPFKVSRLAWALGLLLYVPMIWKPTSVNECKEMAPVFLPRMNELDNIQTGLLHIDAAPQFMLCCLLQPFLKAFLVPQDAPRHMPSALVIRIITPCEENTSIAVAD